MGLPETISRTENPCRGNRHAHFHTDVKILLEGVVNESIDKNDCGDCFRIKLLMVGYEHSLFL